MLGHSCRPQLCSHRHCFLVGDSPLVTTFCRFGLIAIGENRQSHCGSSFGQFCRHQAAAGAIARSPISLPAVAPTPITGRVLVIGHGNYCRCSFAWIARTSLSAGTGNLAGPSMQPSCFTPNRVLDGVRFGFERSVVWSFRRLTRSRDNCPIPARLTLLVDLSKKHREPRFCFRHWSPFRTQHLHKNSRAS
jgi:hypothetical protein